MKYFLFLLCFSVSLMGSGTVSAQVDSSKIEKDITLTVDQHSHVIRSIGISSMTTPERRNYVSDLLKAGYNTKADTARILVRVPLRLIVDAFEAAASKPEGVVVNDNATASSALTPQVMTPEAKWALNNIMAIKERNAARNREEKAAVRDQMKLYR